MSQFTDGGRVTGFTHPYRIKRGYGPSQPERRVRGRQRRQRGGLAGRVPYAAIPNRPSARGHERASFITGRHERDGRDYRKDQPRQEGDTLASDRAELTVTHSGDSRLGASSGRRWFDQTGMSTQHDSGTSGESIEPDRHAERAGYIRAAYYWLERPPTARQAAAGTGRSHDWFHPEGTTWDAVLRDAGIPGYDDVVAEAVRESFEDRYLWQDFVVVRAADFTEETGLGPSHIGSKLREIAEGERTPEAADGLAVEKCATGNGHTKWEVSER